MTCKKVLLSLSLLVPCYTVLHGFCFGLLVLPLSTQPFANHPYHPPAHQFAVYSTARRMQFLCKQRHKFQWLNNKTLARPTRQGQLAVRWSRWNAEKPKKLQHRQLLTSCIFKSCSENRRWSLLNLQIKRIPCSPCPSLPISLYKSCVCHELPSQLNIYYMTKPDWILVKPGVSKQCLRLLKNIRRIWEIV